MDPDANLQEQRELAGTIIAHGEEQIPQGSDPGDTTLDAYRLAELVEALDEWLAVGGFAPKRWITNRDQARQAIREAIRGENTPGQLPGLDNVTNRVLIALFGAES